MNSFRYFYHCPYYFFIFFYHRFSIFFYSYYFYQYWKYFVMNITYQLYFYLLVFNYFIVDYISIYLLYQFLRIRTRLFFRSSTYEYIYLFYATCCSDTLLYYFLKKSWKSFLLLRINNNVQVVLDSIIPSSYTKHKFCCSNRISVTSKSRIQLYRLDSLRSLLKHLRSTNRSDWFSATHLINLYRFIVGVIYRFITSLVIQSIRLELFSSPYHSRLVDCYLLVLVSRSHSRHHLLRVFEIAYPIESTGFASIVLIESSPLDQSNRLVQRYSSYQSLSVYCWRKLLF